MAKNIDDRIAAAARSKDDASREHLARRKKDSARLLATLLQKPLEQRFAALAPGAQGSFALVAADRLTLLKSMNQPARKARQIDIGFASRLEIFRSRLRYRTWAMIASGMAFCLTVSFLAVAYARTPIMDVEITGSMTRRFSVLHPDGSMTEEIFTPYARQYQLMRIKAGIGLLRGWVPSSGYEYFSVPEDAYKRATPK